MTIDITPRQLADIIAASVTAALAIVLQPGFDATTVDVPAVARSVGSNAAQAIVSLALPDDE